MHSCTRSEFLRLSTLGTIGLFSSRALALPPGYTGIPSGIRPYLQSMRPDSVWVSWFTDAASSGTIEWGATADNLTNTLTTATDTTLGDGYRYHVGQITGLSPGTYYFYRVKNNSTTSETFRFRTPVADGTKTGLLRVLVAGDNQILYERRFEKMLACAKHKVEQQYGVPLEEAVDFMLMVGDQVDWGRREHYRNVHFGTSAIISPNLACMTAVGNHETYEDPDLVYYKKLFRYTHLNYAGIISPDPQIYYAYKVANICFIHLNAEKATPEQNNWLRQIVDALKTDTTTDLCVSVSHRPYKTAQGIPGAGGSYANMVMPMLAETEKHVLLIAGHLHYYSRGQALDWPIYHLISSGTAYPTSWKEFSYHPDAAYDQVQKSIFTWSWQILEFDLANRTMEVRCFSEASGNLPVATRWTTQAHNSRLIDSFHRRLGLAGPNKPSLANILTAPVNHPVALTSSPFSTSTGEGLNSTWFQVAADAAFTNLKLNRIRDVENFYGDTGSPNFEPVDVNKRLDILTCTVPGSLPAGTYHARVRHRDTNAMWSAWSDVKTLQIAGGVATAPRISMPKSTLAPGEGIAVDFTNGPANAWIGIYRKGDPPSAPTTAASQTIIGTSGSRTFPDILSTGEWFAAFLASGGYTEIAPRVPFYIGAATSLSPTKENFAEGETVRLDFANAPGGPTDWIGIFQVGQNPGGNACQAWQYAGSANGYRDFTDIPKGYYYAVFMVNDGYQEISQRVRFSVGSLIAQVAMASATVSEKDSFKVTFSKGPGLPTDWIGLYRNGDTPGLHASIHRFYLNGSTGGQATIDPPNLPAGRYWMAMFTNDSTTEVSSRVYFDVVPLVFEETRLENGQVRLRWKTVPGETYTVQKNTSLAPATWTDVRTLSATGSTLETSVPVESNTRSGFYRIRRN